MELKLTEAAVKAIVPPTDKAQSYYEDTEDTGFRLIVGRTGAKTYAVRGRVRGSGNRVKLTIGQASPGPWTAAAARRRARELLGDLANGIDPNAELDPATGQPVTPDAPAAITLREALDLHLGEMEDDSCREVSRDTMRYDVTRLLADRIDRPLAELVVEVVQKIKENGRAHRTQTNRLLAHISAIWNTARRLRRSTFQGENPVGPLGVQKYALAGDHAPEQPKIADDDLPEWYRRVCMLSSSIRRDLQMLALFTALRDSNVTRMRFEIVDYSRGGFIIPMSKTTPFTLPFSETVREILEARRRENQIIFTAGDGGWVFPTLDVEGNVVPVQETKERRSDKHAVPWLKYGPAPASYQRTGKSVLFLPGLHTLRRTHLSIADDIGVPEHVSKLLSNHSFGGRKVHEKYLRAEWSRIVQWVNAIDEALWERLGGRRPRQAPEYRQSGDDAAAVA